VERATHGEPDQADPGETKIGPAASRIVAAAAGHDDRNDRSDGERHVSGPRDGVGDEVEDGRAADHDSRHGVQHVA